MRRERREGQADSRARRLHLDLLIFRTLGIEFALMESDGGFESR